MPFDPVLVDRTGELRIATTDPESMTINIANNVQPPLLDMVMLHEMTHAVTVSHGLLRLLRQKVPENLWVLVEEWSAELVEKHGMEVALAASRSLGRPLCIHGTCL